MNKFKKRAAGVITAAAAVLCAAALPAAELSLIPVYGFSITASAASSLDYINASGESKTVKSYTKIKSSTTRLDGGWYAVTEDVTIKDRLRVTDDTFILLADGCRLTVTGGINVSSGVKLNIYTQKNNSGSIYAGTSNGNDTTAASNQCGIGGNGAKVNIAGGNIYARGGSDSYGIYGSDIHIYWTNPSDSVYATSYKGKVQILKPFVDKSSGSAYNSSVVSEASLKGVLLEAAQPITSSTTALNDGNYASFDKVTVSDRISVNGRAFLFLAHNSTMRADNGITVPAGSILNIYGNGGKLYAGTTNGINTTADDNLAGIGSENGSKAGGIVINSGEIYAQGGRNAAGIGGNTADISILGGTVRAVGGNNAAGIGSGYSDNGATVEILGGDVKAVGGSNAAGIGSGYKSGNSAVTLSYTKSTDKINASSYSGNIDFRKTMYTSDGQVAKSNNIAGKDIIPSFTGFTVTLETNGGTYIAPQTVAANTKIGSLPTPAKNGYTFGGWYAESNFRTLYGSNTLITRNITLYAKWNPKNSTISFNTNGGNYERSMTIQTGSSVYRTELPTPTRSGYLFDGWYTDSSLRYKITGYYTADGDATLYAGWTRNTKTYTVTFRSNGGLYHSETVGEGEKVYDPGIPWADAIGSATWDGWTDSNGIKMSFPYAVYQNETLYASWKEEAKTYTVTFRSNGGLYHTETVKEGEKVYDPGIPWADAIGSATWDGWTDSNGIKMSFPYSVYQNETLYASWKEEVKTYTVTFRSNGGVYHTETVKEGEKVYDPGTPWADAIGSATWDGWTDSNGIKMSFPYSVYQDETLYASWTEPVKKTYTVTFRSSGGIYHTETVNEGDYVYDPGTPWADAIGSATWDGWKDSYSNKVSFPHAVYSDESFTASWIENTADSGYDSEYPSYYGSTFSGPGLVAAIAGGVVVIGGGAAAGVAISKKKKKNSGTADDTDKENKDEK